MSLNFRILVLTSSFLLGLAHGQDTTIPYQDYLRSLSLEELISHTLGLNEQVTELQTNVADLEAQVEGGWSGNGGGFHLENDNIWFIGSDKIPYCVDSSADYPFTRQELNTMVKESLRAWQGFFQQYEMLGKPIQMSNANRSINFPDGVTRAMNFNFTEVECLYNERSELKELEGGVVFAFGKKSPAVQSYQGGGETQLGISLRQQYDHVSYKTTGHIWVENFSRDEEKVRHLLLHELGHMFGMPHDSVFVMDEDIAYQLRDNEKYAKEYFGKIESPAWMYRLQEGKQYVITANAGRRVLDRPEGIMMPRITPLPKCRNENYMPNRLLPEEVRTLFRLPEMGCHQIVLSYVRDGRDAKVKMFTFEVASLEGGSNLVLRGGFVSSRIKPRDNPSPGIFSKFKVTNSVNHQSNEQWLRLLVDEKALMDLPVRGKFMHRQMPPLAVRISNQNGLLLEIFLPRSQEWWVLNNIHNRFL